MTCPHYAPDDEAGRRRAALIESLQANMVDVWKELEAQRVRVRARRRVLTLAPTAASAVLAAAFLADHPAVYVLAAVLLGVIVLGTLGHVAAFNDNTLAHQVRLAELARRRDEIVSK